MRRWWGVVAGLAAVFVYAAPAQAAPPSIDLQVGADAATGAIGSTVTVRLHVSASGSDRDGGLVTMEFRAPAGTELLGLAGFGRSRVMSFGRGCTWVTPKTDVRCSTAEMLFMGGLSLALRIDEPVTGTGAFTVTCDPDSCTDPDPGNNSASIVVHVTGSPSSPSPSRSAKPKPRPTVSHSPAPSPTPSPVASAAVSASPSPVVVAAGVVAGDVVTTSASRALELVALAGVLAVGFAALYALRRQSR